ncbi:hypothetical protein R6Q57_015698 [Mikania cordata]
MNPRANNPNPEFNPFSYDPESLRNLLVQLQQNPNIQHFQQQNTNVQPQPNFQPGFAPYFQNGFQQNISQPRYKSDFVSPNQPDNESTGTGPSSGPMTPKQWTLNEETALGKCYMDEYENKTKGKHFFT